MRNLDDWIDITSVCDQYEVQVRRGRNEYRHRPLRIIEDPTNPEHVVFVREGEWRPGQPPKAQQ